MSETEAPPPRLDEPSDLLLGRDEQKERLQSALERVQDTGDFRAVTLIGAPGLGKTCLIADLVRGLPDDDLNAPRVYQARARRQDISYGVFSRLLRARFGVSDEMPIDEGQKRVRGVAQEVLGSDNVEDVCFFLGQLMGVSFDESPLTLAAADEAGQAEGMRRAVLRRFFEADSVAVPLVLVFDDLQFADPDSLDLLESLVRFLDGRILLLCAGGRELLAQREGWGQGGKGVHEFIEL
jgi:predicted ATPase